MASCPICSTHEFESLFKATDPHYGIAGEYCIVRCRGCGLRFVDPMYSDEDSARLYPEDYYAYQDPHRSPKWKMICKRILGYRLSSKDPKFSVPGRMLDVGCGSGEFVAAMKAQGWDAQGIEISSSASQAGQLKGLQIACGSLGDEKYPSETFDYVRASHSLEHMSNPDTVLDELHRILKPTGRLLIAVPNCDSWNARMFKQYWWHLCPPLHAFGYSVESLSHILVRHRFHVQQVTYNSDYLGILGSAQIWRNRNSDRRSSEGWLFANRLLRVVCGWLARLEDAVHRGDMIEVVATKCDGNTTSGVQVPPGSVRTRANVA